MLEDTGGGQPKLFIYTLLSQSDDLYMPVIWKYLYRGITPCIHFTATVLKNPIHSITLFCP